MRILLCCLGFTLSFASAAEPAIEKIHDGFDPAKAQLFPTVLEHPEAQGLFDTFRAMNYIPYAMNSDGCHARATAMAILAEKMGIILVKVYAVPPQGSVLAIRKSQDPYQFPVTWYFHVAVATHVRLKEGTEVMVFDPSTFDKPVTVDDWSQSMASDFMINGLWDEADRGAVESVYYGERFQYLPYSRDPEKRSFWHPEILDASKREMEFHLRKMQDGSLMPDQQQRLDQLFAL